jgi:ankyrin repeat protein
MAPIHNAARIGNVNAVKAFLNSGTNINTKNYRGRSTPLHVAISFKRLEVIKLLLNRGATINAKNNWGQTPFLMAVYYGHLGIAKLLLNRGANANIVLKNRVRDYGNMKPAIIKYMKNKAGQTILKYKKASNMRRLAASAKALNNVRTPSGRPLPQNSIRLIMSMLKSKSPK